MCGVCFCVLTIEDDELVEMTEERWGELFKTDPQLYAQALLAALTNAAEIKMRKALRRHRNN